MRVKITHLATTIRSSDLVTIYGQRLVRVEGHQHNTAVSVDGTGVLEPNTEIVQHWNGKTEEQNRCSTSHKNKLIFTIHNQKKEMIKKDYTRIVPTRTHLLVREGD